MFNQYIPDRLEAVTPSDTTNYDNTASGFMVETSGGVAVVTHPGAAAVVMPCVAGVQYKVRHVRIDATGTDAVGDIVAFF